jgi:hypothetical protein
VTETAPFGSTESFIGITKRKKFIQSDSLKSKPIQVKRSVKRRKKNKIRIKGWNDVKVNVKAKIKKDERCRRTPGWNEVPFAIYYVLNNRHNEIN